MVSQSSILTELRLHTGPARPDYVPSPEYKEGEAFLEVLGIPLDRADALGMARALLTVRFDESLPEHIRERASSLANQVRWEVPGIMKADRRDRRTTSEQDHPLVEIYADLMDLDDPPIPAAVRTAAERLAAATGAEAVVLFGSRARGDADEKSDWDLCVILPDDVEPGRHTPLTLWPLVSDLGIPLQVVAIRRAVFEEQRADVNSVSHDVARDGVAIIGRRDAHAGGLVQVNGRDPLGYDTSDFLRYARQVSADAVAGKHEDAVQEEVARLSRLFPGPQREVDPQAIGIAFAMLQTGFTEADVVSVLGYMPNLDTAAADLDAMERQLRDNQE